MVISFNNNKNYWEQQYPMWGAGGEVATDSTLDHFGSGGPGPIRARTFSQIIAHQPSAN